MFIIQLKFSSNKAQAGQLMDGHKEWIKRGFDDGVFLVVGSLQPNLGGGIVAHNTSRAELENRVNDDPFVIENVVTAEISEITPARTDDRLKFLLPETTAS
ncbi:YciI family protein [Kiloniella sp.]|uniref:YciI family protein n=1 Tax=Kiloniella sp. TaxID=1938587 RepID=UPI003B0167AA